MARAEGLREYSFQHPVATMTDGVNTTLFYRKTEEDDWKPVITTNLVIQVQCVNCRIEAICPRAGCSLDIAIIVLGEWSSVN